MPTPDSWGRGGTSRKGGTERAHIDRTSGNNQELEFAGANVQERQARGRAFQGGTRSPGGSLRGTGDKVTDDQAALIMETMEMTPGQQAFNQIAASPDKPDPVSAEDLGFPQGGEGEIQPRRPNPAAKQVMERIPAPTGQQRDRWDEEKRRLDVARNYPGLPPDVAMAMLQLGHLQAPDIPERYQLEEEGEGE